MIDVQTAQQTTWEIDPAHTFIDFSVKHLMLTSVKGRFGIAMGTIDVTGDDLTAASVVVEVDAASIDTGNETRDRHLRSTDFLGVEQYPTIAFTSRSIEHEGGDYLQITGDLTICGTTREAILETIIQGRGVNRDGEELLGFTAETAINRHDFGLAWNLPLAKGGWFVGETVKVVLEVQAIKRA